MDVIKNGDDRVRFLGQISDNPPTQPEGRSDRIEDGAISLSWPSQRGVRGTKIRAEVK